MGPQARNIDSGVEMTDSEKDYSPTTTKRNPNVRISNRIFDAEA